MQMLTCEVITGTHQYGVYREMKEIACVAIRAQRYTGRGSAVIDYFAQAESGEWWPCLKKDNRHAKLPTAPQLEWLTPEIDKHHRYGAYGMYYGTIQRSREVRL